MRPIVIICVFHQWYLLVSSTYTHIFSPLIIRVSQASYQVVTEDIGHPFYVIDVYTAVRIIQVCVGGLTHHSFKHVPFWAWRALLK